MGAGVVTRPIEDQPAPVPSDRRARARQEQGEGEVTLSLEERIAELEAELAKLHGSTAAEVARAIDQTMLRTVTDQRAFIGRLVAELAELADATAEIERLRSVIARAAERVEAEREWAFDPPGDDGDPIR